MCGRARGVWKVVLRCAGLMDACLVNSIVRRTLSNSRCERIPASSEERIQASFEVRTFMVREVAVRERQHSIRWQDKYLNNKSEMQPKDVVCTCIA